MDRVVFLFFSMRKVRERDFGRGIVRTVSEMNLLKGEEEIIEKD